MDKKCKVSGCNNYGELHIPNGRRYLKLGYCNLHYRRFKKFGESLKAPQKIIVKCKIESCNEKRSSLGYCAKHYVRFKKHGDPLIVNTVFGENRYKNELYFVYQRMKSRCQLKNTKQYVYYAARGIIVCDRWLGQDGFNNFCNDMGKRPIGMSLDRIDVNGNYEPSNCRWATIHQQQANRRCNNPVVGVSFIKNNNKWCAGLKVNGVNYNLGIFKKYEDAVLARKRAEKEHGIKYKKK